MHSFNSFINFVTARVIYALMVLKDRNRSPHPFSSDHEQLICLHAPTDHVNSYTRHCVFNTA